MKDFAMWLLTSSSWQIYSWITTIAFSPETKRKGQCGGSLQLLEDRMLRKALTFNEVWLTVELRKRRIKMANTWTEIFVTQLLKVRCAFYMQIHVYLRNISLEKMLIEILSYSTAIIYTITEGLIGTDYRLKHPSVNSSFQLDLPHF